MAILFVLSISTIWFRIPFELLKAIHWVQRLHGKLFLKIRHAI